MYPIKMSMASVAWFAVVTVVSLSAVCQAYSGKQLKYGSAALYCVQCSSLEDPLCGAGLVQPTKCTTKAAGCMTYVGKMPLPGNDLVIRSCAVMDMGTFCQNFGEPGEFQHTICMYTCHSSKCNDQPFSPLQWP